MQRDVIAELPTYPYGFLSRVVGSGEATPSAHGVFALNEELFGRFALDHPRPGPDDEHVTEATGATSTRGS